MRFLSQTDSFSCGAIAIINLLKWCSIRVSKKHIPFYNNMLGAEPLFGTTKRSINRLLKHTLDNRIAKIKLINNVSFKQLKKAMKEGACAIVHWTFLTKGISEGHYVFIGTRTNNGTWIIANEERGELFFDDKYIQKQIRTSKRLSSRAATWGKTSPFCWLIIPKEKV